VQPAATEATNLPGSTLLAPGLARLKITLLPHNGHALPARISLAVPVDERADTVPEMRDLSQVFIPGSIPPTALRLAPQTTAAPPTQAAAPWTTPAMRDFSHLTLVSCEGECTTTSRPVSSLALQRISWNTTQLGDSGSHRAFGGMSTTQSTCALPALPRHAQPIRMGGGFSSRQMKQAIRPSDQRPGNLGSTRVPPC
jgi:hypothetical protein